MGVLVVGKMGILSKFLWLDVLLGMGQGWTRSRSLKHPLKRPLRCLCRRSETSLFGGITGPLLGAQWGAGTLRGTARGTIRGTVRAL